MKNCSAQHINHLEEAHVHKRYNAHDTEVTGRIPQVGRRCDGKNKRQ
jgi:hypothetical protein